MKIAISAETTIDLPKELINAYGFKVLPFSVVLGERTDYDGDIKPQDIFDYVEETGKLPRTAAVNQYQFEEHFKSIFDEGYDAIIHFSLSSFISAAYQNAVNASQEFKNVYVIDTRSLSTGIALLACYANKLLKKGIDDPKVIYDKCLKRIPYVQASFVLENLEYLYKGGRCSSLQRFGVNILHICPQIIVHNGQMVSGNKYRGKMKMVVKKYCEDTLKQFNNPDKSLVFLTATYVEPEVYTVAHEVLKEAGFEKILQTNAGATITSHCGPGCIGILYINDGPQED